MEILQTDANSISAGLAGFIELAGTTNHLLLSKGEILFTLLVSPSFVMRW
jgi:hypothetical protein